ncbi:MAG: hypothetical protein ACM37Z_07465, partial [Deltaproteobacteria bacterium]
DVRVFILVGLYNIALKNADHGRKLVTTADGGPDDHLDGFSERQYGWGGISQPQTSKEETR